MKLKWTNEFREFVASLNKNEVRYVTGRSKDIADVETLEKRSPNS